MRSDSRISDILNSIQLPRIPDREIVLQAVSGEEIREKIMQAIADCAQQGGGRIVIPPGSFRCNGPIHLQSHIELHFSDGCFLKFSPEPALYLPQVFTRWEGVELYALSPMIYANGATDIAITGSGIISGGWEEFAQWRRQQLPAQQKSRSFAEKQIPVEKRIMDENDFLRPSFVQFVNCHRILLDGPTFTNTAFWMIHPIYCSDLTIRNIHLDSMMVNNDGIDVESCENVLIENSTFRNGDDAVVIKAGRDQDGLRVGRPTRKVVIRRCTFFEALHGFAIGSELSGGAEDIFVEDIVMKKIFHHAISFKSMIGRGGVIRNIHLKHISVEYAGNHLINLTNDYSQDIHGSALTLFDNISIENLQCNFAENAFAFQGNPCCPVGKVLLKNITVDHANKLCSRCEFADDIKLENVKVDSRQITGIFSD